MSDKEKATADVRAREALDVVSGELARCAGRIDAGELAGLVDAIHSAKRVFATGCGRSGLVARAFAMRLMHLGIEAHVIGETTTPSCGDGDLLVAITGSGGKPTTLLRATEALSFRCRLAAITGNPKSIIWSLAGAKIVVPRETSEQFGGSLFEQSALIVLDATVLLLKERLGGDDEEMRSRHATVE